MVVFSMLAGVREGVTMNNTFSPSRSYDSQLNNLTDEGSSLVEPNKWVYFNSFAATSVFPI